MKQVLLIACFALLSVSCAVEGNRYSYNAKVVNEKKRAIIFLHGYYGANLSRKTDSSRLWLTLPEALWRKNTVARAESDLGIDGAEPLVEDGIFLRVPVIPHLYSIDAYGGTLDWLAKEFPDALVVPFAYDWRDDNRIAAKNLSILVSRLKADGIQTVSLVAHSMGGLVVSYYLRYGSETSDNAEENWQGANEIDHVVMAGVPFRGTMHLLRNIHQGVKIGINRTLVKPEAVASFPSSYQILPTESGKVLDGKLKAIAQDPREAGWWEKEKFGYDSLSPVSEELIARRRAFTRQALESGKAFMDKIHHESAIASPKPATKILTIVGTTRKTIDKVVWLDSMQKLLFTDKDFQDARLPYKLQDLQTDGDESVTRESARLPKSFQNKLESAEFLTEAPHSDIYQDVKVREKVVEFLR